MLGTALALSGCQEGTQPFAFLKNKPADAATTATPPAPSSSVKLVDRDVEAPEVFQTTDKGLWDGRPSLGGVWVAAPDVKEPERVIIRNPANGKFIIGALFRRELLNPGPKLQLSSDAAEALGLLAGQPATIKVTALRRQETPAPTPDATKPALDTNEAIQSKPIADISATASAAIDKATGPAPKPGKTVAPPMRPAAAGAAPAAAAAVSTSAPAKPAAPAPTASGEKAYLQIGIFSVEANATRAAKTLKAKGLDSSVVKEESQGKTFWRVLIGPTDAAARATTLAKVKSLGFADAYLVSK
ncbi:MAG: SPOR domain-containing protein [Rhodobacteraceae bacterium]|nr:SPOR domain-containing protein [Paracoccaceae bacterium]